MFVSAVWIKESSNSETNGNVRRVKPAPNRTRASKLEIIEVKIIPRTYGILYVLNNHDCQNKS